MIERFSNPYSFRGVVQHNFTDALRWSGGGNGFSTLMLINPERQDGPPVSSELEGDCNPESRLMLQELYASYGIDPEAAIRLETGSEDGRDIPYRCETHYASSIYGIEFTEIHTKRQGKEGFCVWVEPIAVSRNFPMSSARNN